MKRTPLTTAARSASPSSQLGLSACGGSSSKATKSSTGSTKTAVQRGRERRLQPVDSKGGTLPMANNGDWDSLDPGDMYYGYVVEPAARLRAHADWSSSPRPGQQGVELVPDLATSLGKPSDDNKTWTYHLRTGMKYEDGTAVTSKDVKYAVERVAGQGHVFPDGPTYFNDYLDLQGYVGAYKDKPPDKLGLKAIETPDDQTIVFHLNKAFSGFDYFAQLPATAPVPQAKDTGTKYKEHVISTGPYMFESNDAGKQFTLVAQPELRPQDRPRLGPQGAAGQDRRRSTSTPPTSTTGSSRATSTSPCGHRPQAGSAGQGPDPAER